MKTLEDIDLSNLDRLLRSFAKRPEPLQLDTRLADIMRTLQAENLDLLPLPGRGRTLQRWQILARVASWDMVLAKLYEGHTDALAILNECAARHLLDTGIWAVWAAEPPSARTRIVARDGPRVYLEGRKAWCSGALQVTHGLLTAWDEDERQQLVAVAMSEPTQQFILEPWQAVGMAATASIEIEFAHSPAYAVGGPGEYLSRPGFWHGGGGIAACWYGAAEALAEYLREHCQRGHCDPHANAHLGAVDAALCGARTALLECAAWIDAQPSADASLHVRRLRAQVEQAVTEVIAHVGRALGANPYCRNSHFARLSADLPVFLRQSHAERDLATLGQQLAQGAATGWRL